MNKIDKVFVNLRKEKKKALIPYISCGDPNLAFTERLVYRLAKNGADLIELGIPYSDPVADGPIIQRASQRALQSGVTIDKIFEMVGRLREVTDIPLILMTYYNPIYVKGIKSFFQRASEVGIDGLIIPDLPIEEGEKLQKIAEGYGIEIIFLIAPTSTSDRIKKVAKKSKGFIYCVGVTGTTGARQKMSNRIKGIVQEIKVNTDVPIAIGFGISDGKTAREAAINADGVIVGSALIEKIEKVLGKEDGEKLALDNVDNFCKELRFAIDDVI